MEKFLNQKAAEALKSDKIIVAPTDTLYGLLGRALSRDTVSRIYAVKKRPSNKPFIILLASVDDLELFSIKPSEKEREILEKVWPGKVSVVLPCEAEEFFYLHHGTKSLAFRVPDDKNLQTLLKESGPLAAPSANPSGKIPAEDIFAARKYFGKQVDLYVDGGILNSQPSTLIALENGKVKVLREGAVDVFKILW